MLFAEIVANCNLIHSYFFSQAKVVEGISHVWHTWEAKLRHVAIVETSDSGVIRHSLSSSRSTNIGAGSHAIAASKNGSACTNSVIDVNSANGPTNLENKGAFAPPTAKKKFRRLAVQTTQTST